MKTTFLFLAFVTSSCLAQSLLDIECPFPEGQFVSSQAECAKYSACQWSGSICHMQDQDPAGYRVASDPVDTGRGFQVQLQQYNPSVSLFDGDITNLLVDVIYHEDYHVQVKITNMDAARYEVPVPITLPPVAGTSPMYSVSIPGIGQPFELIVTRSSNGQTIFKTFGPLTYEDQFIQLTTLLTSTYLYGFGENPHLSFRTPFGQRNTFAIWARDQPVTTSQVNQYGSHPYYMVVEDDLGNAHSVLLFSSNAVEYSTFTSGSSPALTLRTIGGIVDLHFFLGPEPEDVTKQYSQMIGTPAFPTYWSLGFHLSRFGYTNTNHVRMVRDRMKANNIPQDVQTFDIDYMLRYRDFTYDTQANWVDLPQLISELHADNVKTTVILDPALVIDWGNYPPSDRGKTADAFISWTGSEYVPSDQVPGSNDYVIGYVWPDMKVVFPDFLNPATQNWWANEMEIFHQTIDFDAMWIDMNEPANFGTDENRPFNYPPELPDWSLKCPYTKWDSPPYPTKATMLGGSERLSDKTICMTSNQTDGTKNYLHYDVHNLYGWSETVATYMGMDRIFPGKRQTVLSRSTFPGSGKYAIHWLGDNAADWQQMYMSVIGMLEFSMFGIPNVGADICGFFNEPSVEMCTRWMQVGAFYPFSRNHNTINTADQDPGYDPTVASTSRDVLMLRYKYLPYLYVLFHKANEEGSSVIRSVMSVFPSDLTARDIDDQFLWGDGLMVAPVLTNGARSRNVYFPQGEWYDVKTGQLYLPGSQSVNAPLEEIPVFLRGGIIFPWQEPATTTTVSRTNPFGFTLALNASSMANGRVFWDDGDGIHTEEETFGAHLDFDGTTFTMAIQHGATVTAGLNIETLDFFGIASNPTDITVNGSPLTPGSWSFSSNVLQVTFSVPMTQNLTVVLTF